jgi:hypothetical protein
MKKLSLLKMADSMPVIETNELNAIKGGGFELIQDGISYYYEKDSSGTYRNCGQLLDPVYVTGTYTGPTSNGIQSSADGGYNVCVTGETASTAVAMMGTTGGLCTLGASNPFTSGLSQFGIGLICGAGMLSLLNKNSKGFMLHFGGSEVFGIYNGIRIC